MCRQYIFRISRSPNSSTVRSCRGGAEFLILPSLPVFPTGDERRFAPPFRSFDKPRPETCHCLPCPSRFRPLRQEPPPLDRPAARSPPGSGAVRFPSPACLPTAASVSEQGIGDTAKGLPKRITAAMRQGLTGDRASYADMAACHFSLGLFKMGSSRTGEQVACRRMMPKQDDNHR